MATPRLIQGRIIVSSIAVPDPQGRNPKERRQFVVISSNEEIAATKRVMAVAVTTNLQSSPAEHYVLLPFGNPCRTGLRRKSAALCTWLIDIAVDDVEVAKGYLDAEHVEQIVEKVREFKPQVFVAQAEPEG